MKKAWKIAGVVLVAGALLAGALYLPLRAWLTAFLAWSKELGPLAPWVLGAAYLPASVLMLPGSVLTLGTGFVAGLWWGFVAVSIGSTIGATAAFVLGRTVARGWIEARVKDSPRFAAIQQAVAERGFFIVFLLRLSPVFPFSLLNYALGVTKVKLKDYVLASWLGMIPGTFLYVYLGAAAGSLAQLAAGGAPHADGAGSVASQLLLGVGLVATLVVTVVVTRLARRALKGVVQA